VWPVVLALALAAAGIVVTVWRPLAPPLGPVDTPLDDFGAAVLATIRDYRETRWAATTTSLLLGVLVPFLAVATRRGRDAVERLAGPDEHAPRRAALVAVVLMLAVSLARLPIAFWVGYIRDGAWGFRTATLATWLRDWVLLVGGRLLTAAVLAALLVWAIRRWPRSWTSRLAIGGTALSAVFVLLHPLVVQPLTMTTTPLTEGPALEVVTDVLESAGRPDVPILVGDASTRTSRVNAFFTGLGPSRRIVLYDNLLELPPDQIRYVVAHEVAHREHADLARGIALGAAGILLGLVLLRRVLEAPGIVATLRLRGPSDPRMIALVVVLVAVAELVSLPVVNLVSRRAEAAADHRALELTADPGFLAATARTFVVRDLSTADPPWWVRQLYGSHPPPDARIRAAVAFARERDLPLPDVEDLREAERLVRHPAVDAD
jgi:STE24 endopeptidase